jgi:hypothetical protein
MPIKVPRNERSYGPPHERRRTAKDREFSDSLREGFADRKATREARASARLNKKSETAQEVEALDRKLKAT